MKGITLRTTASPPVLAAAGLVIMDLSLQPIAFDRGAAAILVDPNPSDTNAAPVCIPKEILDAIRDCTPGELSSVKTRLRIGEREYLCRAYVLEPQNAAQPVLGLHFERCSSAHDAVHELSAAYNLTDREEEALRGIALGLSGKQLAERMNISPNTVKSYLRLIMAKVGVTSRAEVAAKLLAGWTDDQLKPRAAKAAKHS